MATKKKVKQQKRKKPVSAVLKLMGDPMFRQRKEVNKKGKGSYNRKKNRGDSNYDYSPSFCMMSMN